MQNTNSQSEPAELPAELNDLLKVWQAPAVPTALDQRVLASYRQHIHRPSLWQRFCAASIRVPAPLVAAAAMLFLLVGGAAIAAFTTVSVPVVATPHPLTITKTEIVEVPVVQERVVTRVVYVEKPAPGKTPQLLATQLPSTSQPNEIKLASHVAGDNAYTNVDLSGYQPVEEMKVRIIKGNASNEQ